MKCSICEDEFWGVYFIYKNPDEVYLERFMRGDIISGDYVFLEKYGGYSPDIEKKFPKIIVKR